MRTLGRTRLVPSAEESAVFPGHGGDEFSQTLANAVARHYGRRPITSTSRDVTKEYPDHDKKNQPGKREAKVQSTKEELATEVRKQSSRQKQPGEFRHPEISAERSQRILNLGQLGKNASTSGR